MKKTTGKAKEVRKKPGTGKKQKEGEECCCGEDCTCGCCKPGKKCRCCE